MIPDLISVKDLNLTYILTNKSHAKAIKKETADIIGKTVYDIYDKKQADESFYADKQVLKNKEISSEYPGWTQVHWWYKSAESPALFDNRPAEFSQKNFWWPVFVDNQLNNFPYNPPVYRVNYMENITSTDVFLKW